MRKKAVQQGPQRAQGRIVLLRYGEPLSDARTLLADFFRILLDVVLRETATESLLFGEVIGIVQGRQVRNPFFRFFATL
jgi:hypothetical protein